METQEPVTIDSETGKPITPPRIKLATLKDVRREMATIYREARTGKLDTTTSGRLAYILTNIAKIIEVDTLESRLDALEKQAQSAQIRRIK